MRGVLFPLENLYQLRSVQLLRPLLFVLLKMTSPKITLLDAAVGSLFHAARQRRGASEFLR